MTDALLFVEGVTKHFGGQKALCGVSLQVQEQEIHGIIGPNGSGKTTLFNVISGIEQPNKGRILFEGVQISGLPPHRVANLGIGRTFQMLRIFGSMSVTENLLVAMHQRQPVSLLAAGLRTRDARRQEAVVRAEAERILQFLGLNRLAEEPAANLSIGQRRLLQLGIGLAGRPRLLLLDEPAAGLSPPNVAALIGLLPRVRGQWGTTVVLVEHIMKVVMGICSRVTVLNYGEVIAEGTPAEVQGHPRVIEAYLGRRGHP